MGAGTALPDQDPHVRAELVHESDRTRVTRLFLPGRSVVRKEPLGPDAQRRLRCERAMLERLRGVDGVAQLVEAPQYPNSIVMASRARIVATADQTRRRIKRDLHDGAQQQLVSLVLQLQAVRAAPPEGEELQEQLSALAAAATDALDEVRELARGIHPAILAEGGLHSALKVLARRCPVAVELDVHIEQWLPEPIEIAVYYLVAEALTNVAKHARASTVHVEVEIVNGHHGDALRVRVRDDGRGGATFTGASGLVGLKDRVEALGGRFGVHTASGSGAAVHAELPLDLSGPFAG